MSVQCSLCNKSFQDKHRLQQHIRTSQSHPKFECPICHRTLRSEEALAQHQRDSAGHTPSFRCDECSQSFGSEEALQHHLQYSPAHTPSFDCGPCDRSFPSEEALQQHLKKSKEHSNSKPKPFVCKPCNGRTFSSKEALAQHIETSRVHQQEIETPLDFFFRSFPTFAYDPGLPPAASFAKLRAHEKWRRGDATSDDAWDRYQSALEGELRMWFGSEDDLSAWHALCRAIGIKPLPLRCEQCEQAVRRTHVNIVDLIEWGRRRKDSEEKVQTFRTVAELREYTRRTNKVFRNTLEDDDDGNVVLRHLLRKIFRGGR